MNVGHVTDALDAIVPIRITTPSGQFLEVDAVIDTGFNGTLGIPRQLAEQVQATPAGSNEAILADGRTASLQCCIVSIEWYGSVRELAGWILERGCLLGMELLTGSNLEIEVIAGGAVRIQKRSSA